MTKQLNLLDFCRRAVGEWQDLDHLQCRLVRAEKDVFIKDVEVYGRTDLNSKICLELNPPGVFHEIPLDLSKISKEQIESWKYTFVTLYELYRCSDGITLPNGSRIIPYESSNICDIQNWTKFVDTKIRNETVWLTGVLDENNLENLREDEKEDLYWAYRFRHRSFVLVPAILESLKRLKTDGVDYVILPTGDKVEISSVTLRALEVVPKQLHLFKVNYYVQSGGHFFGDLVLPFLTRIPDSVERNLRLTVRRLDPLEGIVKTKYVLEIPLANGNMYIIDPTSMEFGYRGPKGTLIAHGEWDNYVQNFPGKILDSGTSSRNGSFKDTLQEAQFLGNGPFRLLHKLSKNIIVYFKRRICNYCGRIEGQHETEPKVGARYIPICSNIAPELHRMQSGSILR